MKMVYMSGGNMARHAASICAMGNTCGGVKKGGLAPRVGWSLSGNSSLNRATNTQYGLKCRGNWIIGTQLYGYKATV